MKYVLAKGRKKLDPPGEAQKEAEDECSTSTIGRLKGDPEAGEKQDNTAQPRLKDSGGRVVKRTLGSEKEDEEKKKNSTFTFNTLRPSLLSQLSSLL